MTTTASIKMPRVHFHRTFTALEETRRMIGKMSNPELVASYKVHAAALVALLDAAEIVENYTGAEGIEMASAVGVFMKEFKDGYVQAEEYQTDADRAWSNGEHE